MRPVADGGEGGLGERGGVDVPLVGEEGLDGDLGAVAVRDGVGLGVGAVEPALLLGERQDDVAGLVAGEAVEVGERLVGVDAVVEGRVGVERDVGAGVHDVDRRKAVALADVPVVEVVRGSDLHRAGAFLRVGVGVGDDGDGAADERQADGLAYEVGIAGVVGVDGDAGVAEHGLGAGGGDDEVVAVFPVGGPAVVVEGCRVAVGRAVLERVAQAPEVALFLDLLDLEVGDGGFEVRVPVDQALAAVDEAAVVEVDEDLQHRVVKTLVHGEAVAREVERVAEAAGLLEDGAAGLLLPLPDLG